MPWRNRELIVDDFDELRAVRFLSTGKSHHQAENRPGPLEDPRSRFYPGSWALEHQASPYTENGWVFVRAGSVDLVDVERARVLGLHGSGGTRTLALGRNVFVLQFAEEAPERPQLEELLRPLGFGERYRVSWAPRLVWVQPTDPNDMDHEKMFTIGPELMAAAGAAAVEIEIGRHVGSRT